MMNKLLICTLSLTLSTNVMGVDTVEYMSPHIKVFKTVDDFTNKTSRCLLVLGEVYYGANIRLDVKTSGQYIWGKHGGLEASGIKFRIDDGDIIEKGRNSAGGESTLIRLRTDSSLYDLLDNISKGDEIIIRLHPYNRLAKSATDVYSLKGSAIAVSTLKACITEMRVKNDTE